MFRGGSQRARMLKRSENIVHRLFDRQISRAAPNTHIHRARQLYENIVPNFTVYDVECPDYYFRKFTNDGQYLICFSRNHQDLVIYRHNWLNYCIKGEDHETQDQLPPKGKKFESYFSRLYSLNLASGNEQICKDFLLVTDCSSFGIFATTTTPDSDAPATHGAVPGVPSIERITLYLVRLADGTIVDERNFRDDFIHLAHNMGVFMFDDLLAVLSVRYQLIHILQVREAGMFVDVRTIGAYCREDDELILNSHAQHESSYQKEQAAMRKGKGLPSDNNSAMGSLDAQAKALSLKTLPASNLGYSMGAQQHLDSTGRSVSFGPTGHGDAGVNNNCGESQDADMAFYDGFFGDFSSAGLQNSGTTSRPAEVTLSHTQGNACRTIHETVRLSLDATSSDMAGDNTRSSSAASQEGIHSHAQTERSGQWSAVPPSMSGSGGYATAVGTSARYGRSYSSGSGESDVQSSGRGSHSLYLSSSSDTASDSHHRDPSVSGGSMNHGDSGLVGHYPSDGLVEYVVSSRATTGAHSWSNFQSWHTAPGSFPNRVISPGRGETQQTASGNRRVDGAGFSARTMEPSGSTGTESRHLHSQSIGFGHGYVRPRNIQPSTGRIAGGGDLQSAGPSTGRGTTSVRISGNSAVIRAERPGFTNSGLTSSLPARSGQEPRNPSDDSFRDHDEVAEDAQKDQLLGGMKQRLLSFIFRGIWNQDADPFSRAQGLKRFHYHFQHYVDLVMWKVQFLDRYHLLIKFGSMDGVVSHNSDTYHQRAFFAVYNLESTEILGFYQNSSEDFLRLFEQHCDHFRVAPRYPLYMRFISSYSNNASAREQLRKQKAACNNIKAGSYAQVVKITLASLPYNCQSQSPSAYFDQSLFQFDEKLISATDRHRPCMEHPIKFISRRKSNSMKFKINPGLEHGTGDGRVKRVASFIFHPVFPFAISIQQSLMQPSVTNFHFRR